MGRLRGSRLGTGDEWLLGLKAFHPDASQVKHCHFCYWILQWWEINFFLCKYKNRASYSYLSIYIDPSMGRLLQRLHLIKNPRKSQISTFQDKDRELV